MDGKNIMSLKARAREKVERAGISNYSFDHDILVMCGVRYTLAACDCGEPECDGVRLEKDAAITDRILPQPPFNREGSMDHAFPGPANGLYVPARPLDRVASGQRR